MEGLFANGGATPVVDSGSTGTELKNRKTRRLTAGKGKGLKVKRVYTTPGVDPYDTIAWDRRSSKISNPDGSTVFKLENLEIPRAWSQLATDIIASKYFRKAGVPGTGNEVSARQTVTRIARSIRKAGEEFGGYFADVEDADAFEAELTHMLINQIGAFNSPVWFNCGLMQEYGIAGKPVGNWAWNKTTGLVEESTDAYSRPQLSACFIQSVSDDLMDIADLVKREMRIFKFGSGTGTNFSKIRSEGEKLSSGGTSSGLMSFLEIYDKSAGAIKSGGTTRRAAKMVCLDMDHPDIDRFIDWKMREEEKARVLIEHGGLPSDFNGEAYHTVSGQNSNNSVRVTDAFMKAVEADGTWDTKLRTNGAVKKTWKARELWDKVALAAWKCADPGVQYDSTINNWHTCPNTDKIHASNPCSEYMFLDDSACNLASLNLTKFLSPEGMFDIARYRHACEVFITAQEIIVEFASYPNKQIAQNSHDYRPLGLGYANLGTLLMLLGIPYDSDRGRGIAAALTAIMCGRAYRQSAEIARSKGPFPGYEKNREPFLKVMRMHRDASYKIRAEDCPQNLLKAAREDWDEAVNLGEANGYRNAQATVLAPTGTIGLLMDCDTTGVEPDFALVKFKKLAGGGYFKIVNESVPEALRRLGYSSDQAKAIVEFVVGTNTLKCSAPVCDKALAERGLTAEEIARIEAQLPKVFELRHAFNTFTLGDAAVQRLGLKPEDDVLSKLGFTETDIERSEEILCGRMTVEGAPFLKEEHLAIFDCANKCGKHGKRFIHWMGHIRMMAAVQPFISGAISKTINMPAETTVEDIKEAYLQSWKLGIKAVALYRDGCKASQPLSSKAADKKEKKEDATAVLPPPAPLVQGQLLPTTVSNPVSPSAASIPLKRFRLPKKRSGFTVEAKVGGQKVFLRTGEYQDGTIGEIFVDLAKEGAAFRSMMNCFAMSVSIGLQYGVPLKDFVDMFTFTRFEPQGTVDHPNIKMCTSVIDYIFRALAIEYLGITDFAQVKPAEGETRLMRRATDFIQRPEAPKAEVAVPAVIEAPIVRGAAPAAAPAANPEASALSEHLGKMMGDAPFCNLCGHTTVRNGVCYKCLNCGNTLGCS
ncbi:MAG TPA: vitamin B12-dependent ribonucleotide reductase [Planctomycetota bacterium]|nr:vitamin B12-dependent ribonucleotide reductase [Planctomycetota bacterium]